MKIKAIQKNIVVVLEGTENGKLTSFKTKSGFLIPVQNTMNGHSNHIGLKDRWAVVLSVGPAVKSDIKVGDRILVQNGKWTNGTKIDDDHYVWMTQEDFIIAVDDLYRETNGAEKSTSDDDML